MGNLSKLIVLCDGMWCGRNTKTYTNIYMLAGLMGIHVERGEDSRDDPDFQARYFDGPGLGNTVLDLIFTSSTSPNIAARCIDIYKYIVDRFTDKHEIWMFGLGRGAYVVRCVASMINNCGIIKKIGDDHETTVLANYVYSMYETLDPHSSPQMARTRDHWSWDVASPVKFMGILDTTDPASLPHFLSLVVSKYPPIYDMNALMAVKSVYHAISIHERLPLFNLRSISANTAEMTAEVSPNIHEMWFPGMHYDIGRQNFPSTLGAGIILGELKSWLSWQTVRPNIVLSDLVLTWMLESIKAEDSSGTLIPGISDQIEAVSRRLTSGQQSKGSGDMYPKTQLQLLGYVMTSWVRLLRLLLPGTEETIMRLEGWIPRLQERKILDLNAMTYDYKRPFDQSGAAVWSLAGISKKRYPSATYEAFQLYRLNTGKIDKATYECLVGEDRKAPLMSNGRGPLNISWQGPDFHNIYQGNWKEVLTITKIRLDGEYYVARTVPDFLNEFYGDLGKPLLDWVTKLCVLKPRGSIITDEPQPLSSGGNELLGILNQVHLHLDVDSITAYFADTSLAGTLPTTSGANKSRLLSALSWVVAVFQNPKRDSEGLFAVSCKVKDDWTETEGVVWSSHYEPFRPGKEESSCWTQLFNYACITEVPRDLHVEVNDRPEGLEIDFDLLVDLSRASHPWFTDYGIVLFGFDTALIQLRPVEYRRWHVVRTPGSFITPMNILEAIKSNGQSSTTGRSNELGAVYDAILSSFNLSTEAREPDPTQQEGAIKSSMRHYKQETRPESRKFEYPPGKVYVGWCDSPTVNIGATEPDRVFLSQFDSQTTVPVVTEDIVALASVSTVRNITIGVKLGFLGNTISGDFTGGRARQKIVQPTVAEYQFRSLFVSQLRSAEKTPVILWDDSIKRAWLLPGVSVLFFVSVCLTHLLGLGFERQFHYATPSNNPGASARECLARNRKLRLLNYEDSDLTDFTFGDFVLDVWEGMKKAQSVCYATTDHRKHVRNGVVFGYDLYDLLGTGHIQLRYLDNIRAGGNLSSWELLARNESLHVIFCNHVGSVIECATNACAGRPCGEFCQRFPDTNGVLSCLLSDLKNFFGYDWRNFSETGILPLTTGFEWVPTSPNIFSHFNRRVPDGGLCECCSELDRLQSIVERHKPSIIRQLFHKVLNSSMTPRSFNSSDWLERAYAVRFGSH